MKAHNPWTYVTASTLETSRQAENLRLLMNDLGDAMSRRYYYSSFELDWSLLTETSVAGERTYSFAAPWAYEIVGVELVAACAATGTATLSFAGGVTGAENVVATFAGATTRAYASANFIASCSTSTVSFTLTLSPAAYTLTACKAVIHIRTDRGNAGDTFTQFSTDVLTYGLPTNQATFTNIYTSAGTSVTQNGAATKKPSIQVFTTRNILGGAAIPSSDLDLPIAAYAVSRRMQRITVGCTVANTSTVVGSVRDNTAASTAISVTVTGAGATTLATGTTTSTATIGSQPTTDPVIRIDRGTGTGACLFAYAVVFWS